MIDRVALPRGGHAANQGPREVSCRTAVYCLSQGFSSREWEPASASPGVGHTRGAREHQGRYIRELRGDQRQACVGNKFLFLLSRVVRILFATRGLSNPLQTLTRKLSPHDTRPLSTLNTRTYGPYEEAGPRHQRGQLSSLAYLLSTGMAVICAVQHARRPHAHARSQRHTVDLLAKA